MSPTIWKFELAVQDEQVVWMPSMARVLSVANQHDALTVLMAGGSLVFHVFEDQT